MWRLGELLAIFLYFTGFKMGKLIFLSKKMQYTHSSKGIVIFLMLFT